MIGPTLTFVAGANGSGKITLTRWNSDLFQQLPLLDPDAIANTLQTKTSGPVPVATARAVLKSAAEHLRKTESFAIETTLAGKNYLQMMLDAKTRGFEVVLAYIGTENIEINLVRIRSRVWREAMMFRRKTFGDATSAALKIFRLQYSVQTTPFCFDNSTDDGYRLIAILGTSGNRWFAPKPPWATFAM